MKNVTKYIWQLAVCLLIGFILSFFPIHIRKLCYGADLTSVIGTGFPFVWVSWNHPISGYVEIYPLNFTYNVMAYSAVALVATIKKSWWARLEHKKMMLITLLALTVLVTLLVIYASALEFKLEYFDFNECK